MKEGNEGFVVQSHFSNQCILSLPRAIFAPARGLSLYGINIVPYNHVIGVPRNE